MVVGELKQLLSDLSDDMPVGIRMERHIQPVDDARVVMQLDPDQFQNVLALSFMVERAANRLTVDEYQHLAERTSNPDLGERDRRIVAAMGLGGESGEYLDEYKKVVGHGHPLDEITLKKELGDVAWYLAECCSAHGWSLEEVMRANIEKLRIRFPDKFTSEHSLARIDETE